MNSRVKLSGLRAVYAELERTSATALPFSLYEWHVTWCDHFLRHSDGLRDEPHFYLVRNPVGVCVALVPFIRTERRVAGLTFVSLNLLGADPGLTEIRLPLVAAGQEYDSAAAVDRALRHNAAWDCINWAGQRGAFDEAMALLRPMAWTSSPGAYILDLPSTWDTFRSGLKRNIRESLRHCYNSLKRGGHAFDCRIALSAERIAPALQRFFVLHTKRAGWSGKVEHKDIFATAESRAFLLDVCAQLAERGAVRVFELVIEGQVVASRVGFVVGDSLYLYYSGYDPAWAKHSVMTTTVAEAIKYAILTGLRTVNLSRGNDISKSRWGPREMPLEIGFERADRMRSRLISAAYLKARSGEGIEGRLMQRLLPGRRDWGDR